MARKNQASLHHSGRCTLPAPFYKGKGDISKIETSDTYAYLADALGSSRFVLRNGVHDVASVSYYALTYEPFGEAVASSGFDRLTFASEVRDSTGLVYLGARYYDPELGRFYALDPLIGSSANPQTLDRYVYCANSPLIHTDPRGMVFNLIAGAVGAVVGIRERSPKSPLDDVVALHLAIWKYLESIWGPHSGHILANLPRLSR